MVKSVKVHKNPYGCGEIEETFLGTSAAILDSDSVLPVIQSTMTMNLICQKFSLLGRAAGIILREAGVEYEERIDDEMDLPMFDKDGVILVGSIAIGERFMGGDEKVRMSVETIFKWMERSCQGILQNRFLCLKNGSRCDSKELERSRTVFTKECMLWLEMATEMYQYLGYQFSYADALCAAMISYMEYLNEINWDKYPNSKQWYSTIKSRPSFAPILTETLPGIPASKQYGVIDF